MKRTIRIIALLTAAVLVAGCAHKKKVTPAQTPITGQETPAAEPAVVPVPAEPIQAEPVQAEPVQETPVVEAPVAEEPQPAVVQTLYIPNIMLTVVAQGKQITTPAVLSWQRGTGMVLSIRPVLFEVLRIEQYPGTLTVIDKLNAQYVQLTSTDLELMGVRLTQDEIDALIDERLINRLDEPQLTLSVNQSGIQLTAQIYPSYAQKNVAVNLRATNTANYRQVSLEQLVRGYK